MVDEPEAQPLEPVEEEEGGPIKSFLEHLEDLRWVLIKSLAAGGVAMLMCLLGGNYLMRVLEWPLRRAPARHHDNAQSIRVTFGTNQLGHFNVSTNEAWSAIIGTNHFVRLEIVPVITGTNLALGLKTLPDEEMVSGKRETLPIEIVNLSPAGSFIVATKVAFYGGLVVSAPFIFYF